MTIKNIEVGGLYHWSFNADDKLLPTKATDVFTAWKIPSSVPFTVLKKEPYIVDVEHEVSSPSRRVRMTVLTSLGEIIEIRDFEKWLLGNMEEVT